MMNQDPVWYKKIPSQGGTLIWSGEWVEGTDGERVHQDIPWRNILAWTYSGP